MKHIHIHVGGKTKDADFNPRSAMAIARSAIKNAEDFLSANSSRPSAKFYEKAIAEYNKSIVAAKEGDREKHLALLKAGHSLVMQGHSTKDAELKRGSPEYEAALGKWHAENKAAIAEYEAVEKPAKQKMKERLKENDRRAKAAGLNV